VVNYDYDLASYESISVAADYSGYNGTENDYQFTSAGQLQYRAKDSTGSWTNTNAGYLSWVVTKSDVTEVVVRSGGEDATELSSSANLSGMSFTTSVSAGVEMNFAGFSVNKGTTSFANNMSVTVTGAVSVSAGSAVVFNGDFTDDSSGVSHTLNGSVTYNNTTTSSHILLAAYNNIVINGNASWEGTDVFIVNGTAEINGSLNLAGQDATFGGLTSGSGSLSDVGTATYQGGGVVFSSDYTKKITINADATIGNATFDGGLDLNAALTVTGTLNIGYFSTNTYGVDAVIHGTGGTVNYYSINADIDGTGSGAVACGSVIIRGEYGSLGVYSAEVEASVGTPKTWTVAESLALRTISGTLTTNYNLDFARQTDLGSATIKALDNTTVTYHYAGSQYIYGGEYYNLTIQKAGEKTVQSDLTVRNTMTLDTALTSNHNITFYGETKTTAGSEGKLLMGNGTTVS